MVAHNKSRIDSYTYGARIMNNSFEFSKVKLTKLKPGNSRIRYTDSRTPGLVLDVSTSGTKTFRFRRKVLSKEKVVTLGLFGNWTVDEARKRATEIAYDLDRGIDPNDEKRKLRESLSVAGLYQR